jgi:hypothetical protein
MKDRVHVRKVTYVDIVRNSIEHFIPVFNVNATPANIIEDVVVNLAAMGSMYNDTTLLAVFHCIIIEYTVWAIMELMKMKTVFSFNT